jgi:hypothetical protein
MKLRDKFMTVCGGCDGTGEYEEPIGGFENSITYKLTKCDCENGKELDWQKVDSEIKTTQERLEVLNLNEKIYIDLCKDYCKEKKENLTFKSFELFMKTQSEIEELELYLAELDSIE